jgi:hypothetical protein
VNALVVSEVQMPTAHISSKLYDGPPSADQAGTDALSEVDDADLERDLERLTTPAPKHAR